jgi:hypothetical protein
MLSRPRSAVFNTLETALCAWRSSARSGKVAFQSWVASAHCSEELIFVQILTSGKSEKSATVSRSRFASIDLQRFNFLRRYFRKALMQKNS